MTMEAWGRVKDSLVKRIGKNNYTTWIEPLRLADLSEGVVRFEVPTTFFGDWVSRNFADHILSFLNAEGQSVGRIEFLVPTRPAVSEPAKPATRAKPAARARAVQDDELPGASLDARFTFDSFVVGKPNELAHAAARDRKSVV